MLKTSAVCALFLALCLPTFAHPLLRIHVRAAAYRIAPPRLDARRLISDASRAVTLASQAAALTSKAALVRSVVTQAPVQTLLGKR